MPASGVTEQPSGSPLLDVGQTLAGRRILFIGATGFVGKVALSMLLHRYPDVGTLFVLTRAGAGSSSDERFFDKIASSPVFDPIRERFGGREGFLAFLRARCVALPGDVSRPNLNFSPADLEQLGTLDVIVNCAGLVTFNPTLESAIRINVLGPKHTIELAKKTGAKVVHVSTCFVAGNRDGEFWEDAPVAGYFPRKDDPRSAPPDGALRDTDFSVEAELADCQRIIEQQKALADDRAHVSLFRDRAARRLTDEGRDADDPQTLKLAVQRERKLWLATRLTELGMERAKHWGWTNTYTYTKSLGDQLVAEAVNRGDVGGCIVRPAIVESAVRYPFPGWNEGFTTTAPLAYLNIKGHRSYPLGERTSLDVIPVDLVCAGLIMVIAATIAGQHELVYQLGSSDTNPLRLQRAVHLLGLHKRRYYKERQEQAVGNAAWNALQARLEPFAVDRERFERTSAPLWRSAAQGLSSLIAKHTPRWGAPRIQGLAAHARESLDAVASSAAVTEELFTLFMPFIHDRSYVFRCDNVRALYARLAPADRLALPWDPEALDWRTYWLDVHMRGLEKWVFPSLEEELSQKPRSVYTYKDLLELFDATTKLHKSRTALRELDGGRYTYADLQRLATRVGAALVERGVQPRDNVLLVCENAPAWSIAYFGILKAGAVVVPVDWNASTEEIERVRGWSHAKLVLVGERVAYSEGVCIDALLSEAPTMTLAHQARGDDLASLIFTSGTTGNPKGVMLSHRNFTSLLSKLASVFDLDAHDGLLSVLPLHHTFEFSAGLLMPLMRGAQITYVPEIDAEELRRAFRGAHVTGMIGVPALFELFARNIEKPFVERGGVVKRLFELVTEWTWTLRDRLPPALAESVLNLPRLLFWPVHQRFGGRLRLLISGGAALDPSTLKTLRGLGFNLYEGYGLTEAAPVLAVGRQRTRLLPGSVGEALPGVTLQIASPDSHGIGEIVAQAPNVMLGYFENEDATRESLHEGWLRTGDLGRIEDGRLYVVGRKKELILGPSGENTYPDELEELYRDIAGIKELCVVGLPLEEGRGELTATLVVPSYDGEPRDVVQQRIVAGLQAKAATLPTHKRLRVVHFTDLPLPRTATRKVKRRDVVTELGRLEALRKRPAAAGGDSLVRTILAQVMGRGDVAPDSRLAQLGVDSLMLTELGVALEAAGIALGDTQALANAETVADVEALVATWRRKAPAVKVTAKAERELGLPEPLRQLGSRALDAGQHLLYSQLLETRIEGRANVPVNRPFLVAANHASHLDMGLVKEAIGDWGPRLTALAARDYFFDDPIKKLYFESFTNLVPMDRHGSLRESLRLAARQIEGGNVLLIFPEGTRARDGVMTDFKPAIGYLALSQRIDVLPIHLAGTYDAMPSGALLPKRGKVRARVGSLLSYEALRLATAGAGRAESYRMVAAIVERAVRELAAVEDQVVVNRVLVTGGTGFLGLEVVRQLRARGDAVRVLSRTPAPQLDALGAELWLGDVVRAGDADDPPVGATRRAAALRPSLESALAGCAAVLHLAGFVSRDADDGQRMMRLHVDGTRRVLEAAAKAGVRRVVVASTSGTIAVSRAAEPILDERAPYPIELVGTFPYYLSKIYQEKLALELGRALDLEVVVVNPSLLLGPGDARQSSTGDLRRYLEGQLPVVPTGGLSFIDVRDAAAATINAITARPFERYLLGGPNWTFAELFARAGRVANVRPLQLEVPARVQTALAGAWEAVVRATGRRPALDRASVEMGQLYWYCDAGKAASELGLSIRDPQETLSDTIRDIRARTL